ncbi:right-handed parallel beta-helix repeat-containing protein [Bradyrhizobium sp.]|jgi:hypothetical protein|uniref:right-handed parallel beta-helix repeat-containing protein n=1 Tax=Bradyrhizobium sp. TaxID=376 RepID=UPI002E03E620|nr:right-handed parallel beta-helix repeat-containing protein [Bradyrhizobium sp.]
MRRIALLAIATGCFVPLLASAPASAQATRTWVSGVGDDVNPCSRTAPCKTFAGAISKTATGGEINCLDPGGFGGVTLIKAMTLSCGYTMGSILVSGGPGITINAGATHNVSIRGIHLTGINQTASPGTIGIRILAGAAVSIEDSVISNFSQQGILDSRTAGNTKLFIRNSVISHNTGSGIGLGATNGSVTEIENVSSINNLFGMSTTTGNSILIRRSVFSGNSNSGIETDGGAQANVTDTAISNNGIGVQANGTVRLSNSDISFNTTGVSSTGGQTYGNNRISGNTSPGTALVAAVPAQQ